MLRDNSIETNDVEWTGDDMRRGWQEIAICARSPSGAARSMPRRHSSCAPPCETRSGASSARLRCSSTSKKSSAMGRVAAKERVRVALALDEMPELADALAAGELSFSAILELTRVATRDTERAWIDAARGKNLREV